MNILLTCGAGASSGFIAQSMRKAAKRMNMECTIKAVSDMEINNYVKDYDILLIGPHISYRLPELKKTIIKKDMLISIMDQKKYAALDGSGILEDALMLLNKGENV